MRLRCFSWLTVLCLSVPLFAPGVVLPATAAKKEKKEKPKTEGIITWKVAPETVIIYVDKKKIGTAAKAQPFKAKAGMHMIKLVWGKDEAEEPIDVKAGESVEFQYTFEDSGKPAPAPDP